MKNFTTEEKIKNHRGHGVTRSYKIKISNNASVKLPATLVAVLPGSIKNISNYLIALYLSICFLSLMSCSRFGRDNESVPDYVLWYGAVPTAILQPGEHPLWFKLTTDGPVHIEAVEDVAYSYALIPWLHALHIRFLAETADSIVMTVNRDGFIKLALDRRTQDIALYRFPGGRFWQQYTVGGFVFFDNYPAAVLYVDDRFSTLDISVPKPRTWSFNMNSNIPFSLDIPALQYFPEEEGWNVDTLRLADDGFFYFRAARRCEHNPEMRMFRVLDLNQGGTEISADVFFNSAPRLTMYSHEAYSSLPPLPEGFVYTQIARMDDTLFASWEEQVDFSIGSAGFVVIKP